MSRWVNKATRFIQANNKSSIELDNPLINKRIPQFSKTTLRWLAETKTGRSMVKPPKQIITSAPRRRSTTRTTTSL
jgi:hypothetical protein